MEKVTLQAKFPRNPQKAKEQKGTQGRENPSGQVINPWSDRETQSFGKAGDSLKVRCVSG